MFCGLSVKNEIVRIVERGGEDRETRHKTWETTVLKFDYYYYVYSSGIMRKNWGWKTKKGEGEKYYVIDFLVLCDLIKSLEKKPADPPLLKLRI